MCDPQKLMFFVFEGVFILVFIGVSVTEFDFLLSDRVQKILCLMIFRGCEK